jgi:hypothetical protein
MKSKELRWIRRVLESLSVRHKELLVELPKNEQATIISKILHSMSDGTGTDLEPEFDQTKSIPANCFGQAITELEAGVLKLEITSDRESVLGALGCITFVGFIILLFTGETGLAFLTLGAAIFSSLAYSKTDDYLVADSTAKMIFTHRRFFSNSSMEPSLPFAHIATLVVDGKCTQNKNSKTWSYKAVAITRDGEIFALSDAQNEKFLEAWQFTQALANRLGLPFLEPTPEQELEITGSGRRLRVLYSEQ